MPPVEEEEHEKELTEDAVPVEYAIPVDAREESVVDYAMLVEEPAEAPTEAAIEVVAEEPPAEAAVEAVAKGKV
jgi:hypothetical protein